jgi:hypothetical protein
MVFSDSPILGDVSPSVPLPFLLGNRNNGGIAARVPKLRVDETYKLNLIRPLEELARLRHGRMANVRHHVATPAVVATEAPRVSRGR